ncbi:MAG: hypothetical protein EOO88_48110 [Pedobacter sp.]|nr:MAG: hypothetical protein EOO88_48110 [Pedobacter sp.]
MDAFYDRPYTLPHFRSERYFDYEEIDRITHRLLPIPLKKANELKGVYKTDKQSFYQQLEAYIPIEQAIISMKSSIDFLPFLSPQRKAIFGELVELYRDEKFYGFYALAVPQVEGLFTEMCRICGKPADAKSLPDKVGLVTPFCKRSTGLDYFEHHFPHQRNRFLHYGTDSTEDILILCKEVIHDLVEVIVIFNNLDVDTMHLFKLIRKRDHSEFHSIKDLSLFIKLYLSVSASGQSDHYLNELNDFRRIFIPYVLADAVRELITEIPRILAEIIPVIDVYLSRNNISFDQLGLNVVDKKIIGIKKSLKSSFQYQCQQPLMDIYAIKYFLTNYKKGLDTGTVSAEILGTIEHLLKEYNMTFRKIEVLITKTGDQAKNYQY